MNLIAGGNACELPGCVRLMNSRQRNIAMNGVVIRNPRAWLLSFLLLGMAMPVAVQAATVEYIHTDALGSVVAVTNSSGQVIENREYEPYGRQLAPPQLADGPGYTGHVTDAATGMSYMQQRYYDPGIGRFLSVDPVTAYSDPTGAFNRYWYANNNPYRFRDPDGRCARTTGSMICGGMAGVAAMSKTAFLPKVVRPNMVKSAGPTAASSGQIRTAVDDANTAGKVAAMAGDSRGVKAFNKMDNIIIDSSDWNIATFQGGKVAPTSIAYALYSDDQGSGSVVLNSGRYFGNDAYRRVGRFLHEIYHFDSAFDAEKVSGHNTCRGECSGWDFQFERRVEVMSQATLQAGWAPATMPNEH